VNLAKGALRELKPARCLHRAPLHKLILWAGCPHPATASFSHHLTCGVRAPRLHQRQWKPGPIASIRAHLFCVGVEDVEIVSKRLGFAVFLFTRSYI
jgi:hypothetical protein